MSLPVGRYLDLQLRRLLLSIDYRSLSGGCLKRLSLRATAWSCLILRLHQARCLATLSCCQVSARITHTEVETQLVKFLGCIAVLFQQQCSS